MAGNTALGYRTLYNASGLTGWGVPSGNTAVGASALFTNHDGYGNTAIGYNSMYSNRSGFDNTAVGARTLYNMVRGDGEGYLFEPQGNTAVGSGALYSSTITSHNTAIGAYALYKNTGTGDRNTATGYRALGENTTGRFNTANGVQALYSNTTGSGNTANGFKALMDNTGSNNIAQGYFALLKNTTGSFNTGLGVLALQHNTTGGNNIALGYLAGINLTTGGNNIDIGNAGVAGEANTIRLGTVGTQTRTFVAGVRGITTGSANAITVVIDSKGQLGTMSSSQRFKKEIQPMAESSEAILKLKPVSFQYTSDSDGTAQFGLIAEQVAEINPDLVARDEDGEIYTVRYEAVNAMLLNEFLKEHRKVEQLEATVAQQKKDFESMLARHENEIKALAASVKQQAAQLNNFRTEIRVSNTTAEPPLASLGAGK